MSDEEIKRAASGILYLILVRLMEEFRAVERCSHGPRWQAVLDDLEQEVAQALTRHVRPL
jgi:hypothetical protein